MKITLHNEEYILSTRYKYLPANGTMRPDICVVSLRKNGEEAKLEGASTCHEKDNPSKAMGMKIALTRLAQLLPVETRIELWNEVLKNDKRLFRVSVPRNIAHSGCKSS